MTTGCYLSVRHPNYAERRPLFKRVPDSIDVVLEPAAVIEGRVIDQVSAKPAVEVVVSAQGTNASKIKSSPTVRTDGDGKYQLTSLAAGSYNIWANAPARACPAIDTFAVAAGKTYKAPDLKLVEGAWLEGRVVDADSGKPLTKGRAQRLTSRQKRGQGRSRFVTGRRARKAAPVARAAMWTITDTFGSSSRPAFSTRTSRTATSGNGRSGESTFKKAWKSKREK